MLLGSLWDFLPFLQETNIQFEEKFFQQDGAPLHTANEILDAVIDHFGNLHA
jgi:hypothetical protein